MIHALLLAIGLAQPQGYFGELFDALNSKDDTKVRAFIERRMDSKVPVEEWMRRFKGPIDFGAPFKFLKVVDETPKLIRVLADNRHGDHLGFVMHLDDQKPPRIIGLFIMGAESMLEPPPKDYTGWSSLASLANAIRQDTKCPAIVVAVGQEGKAIEEVADGVRVDGKPEHVSAGEVWHLGSISKSMTSTLIGRLIEMGKLKWTSTLKELLPDIEMKPEYASATVLEIMRHRAGLPQDMNFTGERVRSIVGNETDPVKMRERYAADILKRDPRPNKQFAYSNAGYALLGHIAERLMNKPYDVLMRTMIFEPLGMKSAAVGKATLPKQRPSGHLAGPDGLQPLNMDGPLSVIVAPAGDISMTASDLVRYGRFHLEGLRGRNGLLRAETVKKLHEAAPEEEGGPGYACGWSVGPLPGTALRHGHNGSNGTFRAELAIFPSTGLVVASIVNRGGEADPSPALQAVLAVAHKYAPAK